MYSLKKNKRENAITLMALVITIIVLLILAGITIGMLTGDNGIINNAKNAKEETEISNEKEIIDQATIEAMGRNKRGNLIQEEFQEAMDRNTKEGDTEVTDIGSEFEVYFKESNRYYMVDKNGSILDYEVAVTDPYPGDITKDENGNNLQGTEEEPYQINCIEDLVSLSNMVNQTGKVLQDGNLIDGENSKQINRDTYIVLTRNLNFKSRASYVDSQRTDFGDINGDNTDGNVLMEELTTKTGFRPIGFADENTGHSFLGNFNGSYQGKNHKISNLYINYENDPLINSTYDMARQVGLFGTGDNNYTTISNLEVSGEIKGYGHTGGIIGGTAKSITGCINRANVKGRNMTGGIVGHGTTAIVENCKNYGKIEITKVIFSAGGAGGISGNTKEVNNCENYGTIAIDNESGISAGGYGGISGAASKIDNCTNYGKVEVVNKNIKKSCGGIVGRFNDGLVTNCENYGEVNGYGNAGGIIGNYATGDWNSNFNVTIENCSNKGKIQNDFDSTGGIVSTVGYVCKSRALTIKNCYNIAQVNGGGIIGLLERNNEGSTYNFEFDKVYDCNEKHINIDNNLAYNGEITKKTIEEMKTQQFVDLLNSYSESGTYPNLWKKWKLGEDGYPTFE